MYGDGSKRSLEPRTTNRQSRIVTRAGFLSAREAASLLGVSRNSLYSYVSRGLIRTERDPRDPRVSRYITADVERLRDRKEARRQPDLAARKTLDLGLPVLQSALTLIDNGRLYYRGEDVVGLAKRRQFEDVVRLLWGIDAVPRESVPPACREALRRTSSLSMIERMQALLPIAAARDASAFDTSEAHVVRSGWRILQIIVAAATGRVPTPGRSLSQALATGWRVRHPAAPRLLDAALILCADHELNVSAFTARVVASAHSTPYDVVAAGLAALRGPRHGGHTAHIEALLDEAGSAAGVRTAIAARLERGALVPGFGHPLYAQGDPRARVLLASVRRTWPRSQAAALADAIQRAGRTLVGEPPTIDSALVVLRRALDLPRDAAIVLFAIGRTAGWIAHAMEQYRDDHLIRPRATYVGARPHVRRRRD